MSKKILTILWTLDSEGANVRAKRDLYRGELPRQKGPQGLLQHKGHHTVEGKVGVPHDIGG